MGRFAFLLVCILTVGMFSNTPAKADEPVRSERELRRLGYRPFSEFQKSYPIKAHLDRKKLLRRKNVLPWPVEFLDASEPIGNSMIQFQNYGYPYYHGGCDLLSKEGWWITTPVSGFLEGGHYSYSGNADGSMTKHWIPWPKRGEAAYFELAIVTDEGLRFEFHHVDRPSLPQETIDALNKGGVRVEAGTKIGRVLEWGSTYDHIHYNIITPEGLRINPEYVSEQISDTQEPEVEGVYAIDQSGRVHSFSGGHLNFVPREFIVAGFDRKNAKSPNQHPFHSTLLKFANGTGVGWDFRAVMATMDGRWPALWEFYLAKLRTPSGQKLETFGDYGAGFNLVRLLVPQGASGQFEIEVKDMVGNKKVIQGEM